MKSRSTISQPRLPHALENPVGVAADVQAHPGAHGVQPLDHPLLVGQDELLVDLRADQRRGRIADADQVHARLDLGLGEAEFHLQHELEQVADELRVVVEIQHQAVDAAQVGGLGAGAFDPAFDQQLAADLLAQQGRRLDAVVHPPAAERIGHLQLAPARSCRPAAQWVSSMAGGWSSK